MAHSSLFKLATIPWRGRSLQGALLYRLKVKAAQLEGQLKENEQAITQIERLELKYGMHEAEAGKLRESLGDSLDGDMPSAAELQVMCEKVPPQLPWILPTAGSGAAASTCTACEVLGACTVHCVRCSVIDRRGQYGTDATPAVAYLPAPQAVYV